MGYTSPVLRRLFGFLVSASPERSRRRRWLGAFVAICLALILLVLAWTFLVPDIVIDPGMLLVGVAACMIAWTFYVFIDRRPPATGTVVVNYDFKLVQPSLPGGRYRFELEVFHELEVRGRHERQRQALIELVFKKQDHPDVWEFCQREIARFLKDHRRLASERYPDSTILVAPPPRSRARLRGRNPSSRSTPATTPDT